MQAEVTFTITPPIECTKEQFEEWIDYCLKQRHDISLENPLHEYDLDLANNGTGSFMSINIS